MVMAFSKDNSFILSAETLNDLAQGIDDIAERYEEYAQRYVFPGVYVVAAESIKIGKINVKKGIAAGTLRPIFPGLPLLEGTNDKRE